ncbi:MAG: AAA family ATPase [Anaerolineales bacterium]
MRIHYVRIENFRNFKFCEAYLGQNIVLVGENKAGKSNFLHALRLILDPTMSDAERRLSGEDFWDGIEPFKGNQIKITIQLAGFTGDPQPDYLPLSLLTGDCIVETTPESIAQLTYVFLNAKQIDHPELSGFDDYDFKIYAGKNENNEFKNIRKLRENIPLTLISAIRDIASDNRTWSRSPLRGLIELTNLETKQLEPFAEKVRDVSDDVVELQPISDLQKEIRARLNKMVGDLYSINPELGLNATTPSALEQDLRLFADGDKRRTLDRASLGLQNALYLTLLALFLEKQEVKKAKNKERYLPIVALEEPEAHLHPHLQRLVFNDYLESARNRKQPVIISTHSPQLASSAQISDLAIIRETKHNGSEIRAAYNFTSKLTERELKDLDRFLDITKSEMLFSKGVLLVEGDVEVLLIGEFLRALDVSFDKSGISIINVYGTNFTLIANLAFQLGIPFAILTDGDPEQKFNGIQRGLQIIEKITDSKIFNKLVIKYETGKQEVVKEYLAQRGVFINKWTIETTLIDAGLHNELKLVFNELGDEMNMEVKAGANHIDSYLDAPTVENMKKILNSIADSRWGKGRFAHRLVKHISEKVAVTLPEDRSKLIPLYIRESIMYLVNKVKEQTVSI